MPKLTKRTVDAARPKKKKGYHILWDDDLKGFGLVVTAAGTKTYVIQYRTLPGRAGRTRRLKLGRHGELTPKQAREMAEDALADVRRGKDPLRERREKLKAPTVEELAELYLERHAIPKNKASSVACARSMLKNHILPAFGRRKAAGLSLSDVQDLHHAMRKTPTTANRTIDLLSSMLSLAEQWGIRPRRSNPCSDVRRYKENKRERFLSREELARLGDALDYAQAVGWGSPSAFLALRLLLLTGARKSEILTLKWSEVDFERRCLRLEDSKTGSKVILLNTPALKLLKAAPRVEGNPYVCPGMKEGTHYSSLYGIWHRIRTRAGLEDVRIHDLRHSFASVGVGGGLSLPKIGALLGHTKVQTTARYAHLADDPLQEATELIGAEIAAQLAGDTSSNGKPPAEPVQPPMHEASSVQLDAPELPQGLEGFLS